LLFRAFVEEAFISPDFRGYLFAETKRFFAAL
jgi:hypothetical protein